MNPTRLNTAGVLCAPAFAGCSFFSKMSDTLQIPQTSLWANRKCLLICCVVSIANMQYGLDSAAVGGLQAMPGFLVVFGYPDPAAAGGYAIDVSSRVIWSAGRRVCVLTHVSKGHVSAADHQSVDARVVHVFSRRRILRALVRPQGGAVDGVCAQCRGVHHPDRDGKQRCGLRGPPDPGVCQWVPGHVFQRVHLRGFTGTFARRHGCSVCVLVSTPVGTSVVSATTDR